MTDGLSRAHADLLNGQYDSLDRIVLNAYFRFTFSISPGAISPP